MKKSFYLGLCFALLIGCNNDFTETVSGLSFEMVYVKGGTFQMGATEEQVSWNEVQDFLKKLSALTGKKYVLPTEAQWEYAARGGAKSKGYKYSGSNEIDDVAWYWGNSEVSSTYPVGTKAANELGIYDMSGNVWEWCRDWKGQYADEAQFDPTGPVNGSFRVRRGGSWGSDASYCRVSHRCDLSPSYGNGNQGFRVALLP